jgi:hypothetical protein
MNILELYKSGALAWPGLFAGIAIFVIFGGIDLLRHGRQATRWKEYVFLVVAMGVMVLYAVLNDMVTVRVSPAYFDWHLSMMAGTFAADKSLAIGVAVRGSWWGGLVLAAALLIANNPSKTLPRLPGTRMYTKLLYPFLLAAAGAIALGYAQYREMFSPVSDGPGHDETLCLLAVGMAHWGAYGGAVIGAVVAIIAIRLQRRALRRRAEAAGRQFQPAAGGV